jgi:predicted Zn-dependent protease
MIRKNFGQLLIECNRLEDADRQFQSILVRIRHYWAAYSLIGRLAIKLDRPKESETQIRAALKLDPENLDFHVVLADALEHQSRNAEAQAVLETLVRKNPKNTTALRTLGRFYVRSGKLDDAKARLSEALEGDPNSAELRVDLGMIAVQQKNLDEAKEHLEAAAKLRPDWPDIQKHLADLEKERLNGLPADQK